MATRKSEVEKMQHMCVSVYVHAGIREGWGGVGVVGGGAVIVLLER